MEVSKEEISRVQTYVAAMKVREKKERIIQIWFLLLAVAVILFPVYIWIFKVTGHMHFVWPWESNHFYPVWLGSIIGVFAIIFVLYEKDIPGPLVMFLRILILLFAGYLSYKEATCIISASNFTLGFIRYHTLLSAIARFKPGLFHEWMAPSQKGISETTLWIQTHHSNVVMSYYFISPFLTSFGFGPFLFATLDLFRARIKSM